MISDASMQMIQKEALEVFAQNVHGNTMAFAVSEAVKHAFEHALEEGIITEHESLHNGIDREHAVEKYADAMAQADGYDPNSVHSEKWNQVRMRYMNKASLMIGYLETLNG